MYPLLQGPGEQLCHRHRVDDIGDVVADEQGGEEHLAVAVIHIQDAVDDTATRHLNLGPHLVGAHKGDFHAREERGAQQGGQGRYQWRDTIA